MHGCECKCMCSSHLSARIMCGTSRWCHPRRVRSRRRGLQHLAEEDRYCTLDSPHFGRRTVGRVVPISLRAKDSPDIRFPSQRREQDSQLLNMTLLDGLEVRLERIQQSTRPEETNDCDGWCGDAVGTVHAICSLLWECARVASISRLIFFRTRSWDSI